VSPASIYVSSSAPYNLHLTSGASSLINVGTDLSGSFTSDIDGGTRYGVWDIGADEVSFAPLNPMVVYTEDETSAAKDIIRHQTYEAGWSGEFTVIDTNNPGYQYGHIARRSPNGNEVAVVFTDSGAGNKVYVTLYNGSTWTAKKELVGTNVYLAYDAAYEQSTGRLMIVGRGTNIDRIKYWVWNGSSWFFDGAESAFLTDPDNPPGTQGSYVTALKIASKPGANEIALIAADDNQQISGLIWNGSAWGNERQLNTYGVNNQGANAIAVEYQQTGTYAGRAIMAWGESNNVKK